MKETGNTAGERTGSWFSLWTVVLENCLCFRAPGWSWKSNFSQAVINCVFSIFRVHSLKILTLIYLSMLGALFQYSLRALILPPPPRLPRPCGIGSLRLGNKTKVLVCCTQHCHMSLFSHFSSDSALCTLSASIPLDLHYSGSMPMDPHSHEHDSQILYFLKCTVLLFC